MSYLSRYAVREEAGFLDYETGELLNGTVNGVNKKFATNRRPIVGMNERDRVSDADVVVMVDGVPVDVYDVEAASGLITLKVAPASGTTVTVDYASSPLRDSFVDRCISDADGMIDAALAEFGVLPLVSTDPRRKVATRAALYFASGFALVRDYGKNTDTEETSKDGYEKIKQAEKMLAGLVSRYTSERSKQSSGTVVMRTDGHVFDNPLRPREGYDYPDHERFMRKR